MAEATEVNIESTEKEAVAFKLMQHIGNIENQPNEVKSEREYWLTLYRQCYRAVTGRRAQRKGQAAQP